MDDTYVSRVQCEFILDRDTVQIRNVGQRNPTLVNGVATEHAVLAPGDIISFAGSVLLLDNADQTVLEAKTPVDARTTQLFSNTVHLRADFDSHAYGKNAALAGDLHGLFGLVRSLGRADTLDALVSQLIAHLRQRLKADELWLGWRVHSNGDIVLYPPLSPEETRTAPIDIMHETCGGGEGLMLAPQAGAVGRHTMAAPLVHGGDCFGAIAARASSAFTGSDLQYLVAAAECCAPIIRGAERLEQLQRDTKINVELQSSQMQLLGESPAMQALHIDVRRAAAGRANVLFLGETGVGKELTARMLHELSPRKSGPYIVINCAAITSDLFESEVFGHERGAFTGAIKRRKGLFELAHGGTLFLDEVAELSLANQAHLLRAVETGTFRPVGAEKELKVDVRVVSATNRTLPDCGQSYFRMDLYHRLAGIVIKIKPLRERVEDIAALADFFLQRTAPHAPAHPVGLSAEALAELKAYSWPGNIRELRNVIERACYMTQGARISVQDIGIERIDEPAPHALVSLDEVERLHLLEMMRTHNNNVRRVAQTLGISRSAMYYKLSRFGIDPRATAPQR